jgi:uncharacterized protein (TIGR02145 family)
MREPVYLAPFLTYLKGFVMENIQKLSLLLVVALTIGCRKDPFPGKVEIFLVRDVTHNSLVVRTGISGTEGGVGLQVKGICYSKDKIPVVEGDHFEGANLPGTVEEALTGISGLDPDTRYTIRAYFETNVGVVYSDTLMIRTKPVEYLTDPRDGHKYEIIAYGNHTWMVRNLDYVSPGSLVFENKDANSSLYGRLYPYNEAVSVCPPGWRLPSDEDWKALEKFIGVAQEELDKTAQRVSPFGGMMKEPGMRLWESSNALKADNHSGFSIVPSGWYSLQSKEFALPQLCAGFWTKAIDSKVSFTRLFYSNSDEISRFEVNVDNFKLSIRCIK